MILEEKIKQRLDFRRLQTPAEYESARQRNQAELDQKKRYRFEKRENLENIQTKILKNEDDVKGILNEKSKLQQKLNTFSNDAVFEERCNALRQELQPSKF